MSSRFPSKPDGPRGAVLLFPGRRGGKGPRVGRPAKFGRTAPQVHTEALPDSTGWAVRRRRGRRPPRPVTHLAAQVHVGHVGIAPPSPAVEGGGRGPELARADVGYLRRLQAAGPVSPHLGHDGLELLRAIRPAPGGEQLGAGRRVLAAERHRAPAAAPVAAVSHVRPAVEPGTRAPGHRLALPSLAGATRDGAAAPDPVSDC